MSAPNAPDRITSSMLMLMMPSCSTTTSPSDASANGVAVRTVASAKAVGGLLNVDLAGRACRARIRTDNTEAKPGGGIAKDPPRRDTRGDGDHEPDMQTRRGRDAGQVRGRGDR